MNGPRNSPLMSNSSVFYQPTEKDRPDDLPEADQTALGKESVSLLNERSENGATALPQPRAAIPSYEEATRRNNTVMSKEVIVTPKRENLVRSSEVVHSKNEKVRSNEDNDKKKSSIWYEYGEV